MGLSNRSITAFVGAFTGWIILIWIAWISSPITGIIGLGLFIVWLVALAYAINAFN